MIRNETFAKLPDGSPEPPRVREPREWLSQAAEWFRSANRAPFGSEGAIPFEIWELIDKYETRENP